MAGAPDPSKVRVYGPGVEHGVLAMYQSRFICDTRGAGAGQLTVRIRGPKGNEILSKIPPKCRLEVSPSKERCAMRGKKGYSAAPM